MIDRHRDQPETRRSAPALHLPRTARLNGKGAFDRVFASRKARTGRFFRIHYAPVESPDGIGDGAASEPRMGMTVSRRISKRAVQRNRIRRQIRESFRLWRLRIEPFDYVVRALPGAEQVDNPALRLALDELWIRFQRQ